MFKTLKEKNSDFKRRICYQRILLNFCKKKKSIPDFYYTLNVYKVLKII